MAFEFLDADKSGKISLANLKKRIGVFFPNMTAKEYRFLMNGRKDISLSDLSELLIDNEITNFDPVAEAFKAYDPLGEGKIDPAKLRDVFENFGGSSISEAELEVVKRVSILYHIL
jgi:Ca2+-binding EF-hand superfamily protein